ncbi:hypothetical protein HMPREF1531_01133 [Propionibacterium sp. oral taxon 192 str. F0372]|nr:hypothetical protein HMPREF1531_01133 [Propionibacterium sp. oral taxon 192 str. F0372]
MPRSWSPIIIPAYAGCTRSIWHPQPARRHHPRLRGVHTIVIVIYAMVNGSSPLTRGAHAFPLVRPLRSHIIPAYAGCTPPATVVPVGHTNHPRLRGVHTGCPDAGVAGFTSSPLTRGAHSLPGPFTGSSEIIPAYAGCTRARLTSKVGSMDHPRLRGVHTGSAQTTLAATSIIPAYAGCTQFTREYISRGERFHSMPT